MSLFYVVTLISDLKRLVNKFKNTYRLLLLIAINLKHYFDVK
jgi:hypothetical protein